MSCALKLASMATVLRFGRFPLLPLRWLVQQRHRCLPSFPAWLLPCCRKSHRMHACQCKKFHS